MTKKEFQQELLKAQSSNSLLIDKHNPDKLELRYKNRKTVISHEVAHDLDNFIKGIISVTEYQNNGGPYYVIEPAEKYIFASSGVTHFPSVPFLGMNRIAAVKGQEKNWHIFGDDTTLIDKKVKDGKLKDARLLE